MGWDLKRGRGLVTVEGGLGQGRGYTEWLAFDLKGQETPIGMISADFIMSELEAALTLILQKFLDTSARMSTAYVEQQNPL